MDKGTEEKIGQLQMYEQSIQSILMQKQQFQGQLSEVQSALSEIAKSEVSYKIIGNLMVKAAKEEVQKELEARDASLHIRLKSLDKQETTIREKAKALQEEIMGTMKDEEQ